MALHFTDHDMWLQHASDSYAHEKDWMWPAKSLQTFASDLSAITC